MTTTTNWTGLFYGLGAVLIGQLCTVAYSSWQKQATVSDTWCAIQSHFSQGEGVWLLATYLTCSWHFGWLPPSYYNLGPRVRCLDVVLQLIVQDGCQYAMHRLEHKWKRLYRWCHRDHHRHVQPQWFDAFSGSVLDTSFMVIVPLMLTSRLLPFVHTKSYMTFGTLYSCTLVLIHSDQDHVWEPLFSCLYLGTSADHRMHHKWFRCNYGHVFMWWDVLCDTYKTPIEPIKYNKTEN